MGEHTPGPWRLDGGVVRGTKADGNERPIAEIYRELRSSPETIANAHIVAAAPDLLAALEAFNLGPNDIVGAQADYLVVRLPLKAISAAAAAIAKATAASLPLAEEAGE